MDFGVVQVMAITGICYLLGMACKTTEKIPDKIIPIVCGVTGTLLGIAAWLTIADFPASNWLEAAWTGAANGLMAVGINQIGKQLNKE